MKKSVWTAKTDLPVFDKLNGDKKTEVLIIGGGLCGILCALFLKQADIDCIVVEGNEVASGTTKNTTAKITAHTVSGSQHFSRRSITSSCEKMKYPTKNPTP